MLENLNKQRFLAIITAVVSLVFLYWATSPAFATSETINFQGKIVRNDAGYEGLNVVPGSPSCVIAGNSNDTCDFRVKYYNANTGGTLLGTEVFNNTEIGYYDGVFNLVLGSGSFTGGSESSFRNIFLNTTSVFVEVDFAPDGSSYTETFLDSAGLRMGVRAAAYAISSSGANKQFQFNVKDDPTGYSNIAQGQVFFDGDDNVLRLYDGSQWLAVQAYVGDYPSLWTLNDVPATDVISSYTGLDVAFGGDDSTAPFFYDVSAQLLTLTNTSSGESFRVNDQISDTSPFVIDASGNVGIGTSTPGGKLEVTGGRTILSANGEEYTLSIGRTDGAGAYWLGVDASATPSLKFKNAGGNDRLVIADSGLMTQTSANAIESGIILKRPTTDATHIQWQLFGQTNNKDFWITAFDGTTTRNYIKFYWDTLSTNFDAGNVGIGVASPSAFFAVKAATTSSAQINLVTSAGVDPSAPNNGDLWWNGTNLYFYDGSSNVDLLVGTGGGGGGGLFTDGGAVTYLTSTTDDLALGGTNSSAPFFFDEGAELLALTNTTAGLSFRVNDEASDTTPFVIDADGNVGIGTSTPGAKLDIAGSSSTISNTAGDITIDSNSGNISFAGDSLTNVLNATFSGDVTLNGSQLRLGNHSSNPTSIGEGSLVYNSTDKKLYYYKDTGWSEVGKVYSGSTDQTLRHNGTDWVASSALQNDGTNVTATGQVRVGNFGTKPAGAGAGALVYDTTLGSLFVYDGADWKAVSTSTFLTTTGTVNDGSYLQLTHNLNTFDVLASAWVKVGTQWKQALDNSNAIIQDFENEFSAAFNEKTKVSSVAINYNENDLGTGTDGAITVGSNVSINSTNSILGRSCVDGGDAVNYSVTALTSTTATLESTPSSGCLAVGDEVLLINMRGTVSAMGNVGNYETLRIAGISTNTITFLTAKSKYYGDGTASNDTNIGLNSTNQAVMLQRVPNYTTVTVSSTFTFTPDAWVAPTGAVNNGAGEGGVMFFRATGTVTSTGNISASARGYIGAVAVGGDTNGNGGHGGEAYCGPGGVGNTGTTGGNGAAGGGAGGNNGGGTGGNGSCGGGGGAYSSTGGTGSVSSGGSGGGGGGYFAGGAGGYGTAGTGGAGAPSGGTNSSGNGGTNGGGGGGTYGDPTLTKLYLGSSGGSGGAYTGGDVSGVGGNGGGVVYIAANTITVAGTIQSIGSGGTAGSGTNRGGGGGGSGGSIKLVGNTVTMGTTLVTATGGAGGVGSSTTGGTGGAGRVAVYYASAISGSTNPVHSPYSLSYNNYATFIGKEVHTPRASAYGNIGWTENLPSNTDIQVQTRSGASSNSTDGTWEAWKPTTTSATIDNADTHPSWTGTNATVVDGDITRNVDYFEDEDEISSGNLTKFTSTSGGGYAEVTISATDLSSYKYITMWVRSSIAGNTVKLGMGNSVATTNEETFTIDTLNTWQKIYWDLSDIVVGNRNAITKFRVTAMQNSEVVYIDNVKAESYLTTPGGSVITSTANEYVQYRVILTTTSMSATPTLSNLQIGYTNADGTYTIDANRVKKDNDAYFYSSNRLTLTQYDMENYEKIRTLVGPNQVSQNGVDDFGTGNDGAITTATTNINATSLISGRVCADGGDAVNYSVVDLGSSSATLESAPSSGCLAPGDEVLLINLRGTLSSSNNVGNYETLRVSSIASNVVTFQKAKSKYYGNGATDDTNIGLGSGNQTVMLQRVPNYTNVTVAASQSLFPDAWVSPTGVVNNGAGEGGVIFFRANGTVSIGGTVTASARGYIGAVAVVGDTNGNGGHGGEAYCGAGGIGDTGSTGGNGAAGGGAGSNGGGGTGGNGSCGGGGGAYSGTGGTGSASSGGSGGGGGGYFAGGAGGYGTAGTGGAGAPSGGTNSSGNGGANGGGGGGTYGDSTLTKLYLGSSGGSGGAYVGTDTSGAGGTGGGIIYVSATNLTVSGSVQSIGGAGGVGSGTNRGGGGGAAGGSIKLVGSSVTIGSSLVVATGGAGGAGSSSTGGTGGSGRIAIYYGLSINGTASPAAEVATVPSYNYGVFVSNEIPTYQATEYDKISWNFNSNGYGAIQLQTRSGASNNSTDGTWETWKPVVANTNRVVLNDMNTPGDWSVTNQSAPVDGDRTRNVDYFEDEDEDTAADATKLVSSSANGYAEDTIPSTDLSNLDYIAMWVNSPTTGNIVKIGFGESVASEQEKTFHIDATNTWQKLYFDISKIDPSLKNAVTKLRITILPTTTTVYVDDITADRYMRNSIGTVITSSPNDFIQYRAIFTTAMDITPVLYDVQLTWKTGYKLVNVDSDTTRLYNYSGQSQDLKITITNSGGAMALGSGWTESGGNIYRATGNVGIGDATPDTTLKVVGSLCVKADANDCAGNTAGTIYANNLSIQSADLAEMYKIADQSINEGDLVSLTKGNQSEIEKADVENAGNLMGVISTAPALVMNDAQKVDHRAVALVGRVPIKVIRGSINISEGDSLGVSPVEGYGSKITQSGFSVARAIESTVLWNEQVCTSVENISKVVWPSDKGNNEGKPCFTVPVSSFTKEVRDEITKRYSVTLDDDIFVGKVMGYVSVQWFQPEWLTEGISELVDQYNNGKLGGDWNVDGDKLITNKDAFANSFSSNYGTFNVLSGGILNIGEDKFTVDTGGNVGIAGDILISGNIKGADGNVGVTLGDSDGAKAFEIRNSDGTIVFSVDSKGEVGGAGVYKTGWLRVEANSHIDANHNFGKVPSDVSMVISKNSDGEGFSTKGLGSDYYYESTNDNSLRIFNKTGEDVFVKLTVQR